MRQWLSGGVGYRGASAPGLTAPHLWMGHASLASLASSAPPPLWPMLRRVARQNEQCIKPVPRGNLCRNGRLTPEQAEPRDARGGVGRGSLAGSATATPHAGTAPQGGRDGFAKSPAMSPTVTPPWWATSKPRGPTALGAPVASSALPGPGISAPWRWNLVHVGLTGRPQKGITVALRGRFGLLPKHRGARRPRTPPPPQPARERGGAGML